MAIILCTDDMLLAMLKSLLHTEAVIERRFEFHGRKFIPADFKEVDLIQKEKEIVPLQMAYMESKGRPENIYSSKTTPELHRELKAEKISQHQTAAGRIAWLATSPSTSACLASMELHGKVKTASTLQNCRNAYEMIPTDKLASFQYAPLQSATLHIRDFSDVSFQSWRTSTHRLSLYSSFLTGTTTAVYFTSTAAEKLDDLPPRKNLNC